MANRLVLYYTDEDGVKTSNSWWTMEETPEAVVSLVDAIKAFTAAALQRWGVVRESAPLAVYLSAPGPYDIRDKIRWEMLTSGGNTVYVESPAPIGAAMLPNSDDVDMAYAGSVAFRTACIALLRHGADTIVDVVRGYRVYRSRKR